MAPKKSIISKKMQSCIESSQVPYDRNMFNSAGHQEVYNQLRSTIGYGKKCTIRKPR